MALRDRPTLAQLPTNNLYTPVDNTPFRSIASVSHPWGVVVVSVQSHSITYLFIYGLTTEGKVLNLHESVYLCRPMK